MKSLYGEIFDDWTVIGEYIINSKGDCNAALKRIIPKIDMNKINALIDETLPISDLQKTFYKRMLAERKEKILDKSLQLLPKKERVLER